MKLLLASVLLFTTTETIAAQQQDYVTKDSTQQTFSRLEEGLSPDFMCSDYNASDQMDISGKFSTDNSQKSKVILRFLVPTAFVSYGIACRFNKSFQQLDYSTHHEVSEHVHDNISVDDYTQFASTVAVFGLDIAGLKAKHSFKERVVVATTSHIVMLATVHTMKQSINVLRPDKSKNNSFPSGHTATAFAGARILHEEYGDYPLVYTMGYLVAAATGTLRVVNKRHWVSDVITGAGIGILSVEVGYIMLPVFRNMFGIKSKDKRIVVVPSIGTKQIGIGVVCNF
ncbi:phosphatase PAP2 family protein [Viscerimonas tarda]